MDKESNHTTAQAGAPARAAADRLDEVVKRVKAELLSGQERRGGFNPYDGQLGRPSHDVWARQRRG